MTSPSSVIFWLLLTATICIDAVVLNWSYIVSLQRTEELFVALVCGQLNASCVWASFSPRSGYWRCFIPFAVAFTAALCAGWVSHDRIGLTSGEYAIAHAGIWATQAALVLGVLWILRKSALQPDLAQKNRASRWRFSIAQLLVLMTTAAILVVILRKAELIHRVWVWIVFLLVNNLAIAVAIVLIQTTGWRRLSRAAASAGVAIMLGVIMMLIRRGYSDALEINVIHAFILFAWLEFGGLMTDHSSSVPTSSQAPTT
jgi:hypothetical protein